MLLNHNYAIETFLKELYHIHTFYSFKCSVIFTTDSSVTSSPSNGGISSSSLTWAHILYDKVYQTPG